MRLWPNRIYAMPDGSGFEKLEGKRADAWKQRIDIIRAKYVEGIGELDRRSQSQFGAEFVRLTSEQQDRILAGMEHPALHNEAAVEEAKSAEPALQQTNAEIDLDFFPLLALHTRQGFYSDPIYGGNKNRVGWKLIGFEGPESPAETHAGRFKGYLCPPLILMGLEFSQQLIARGIIIILAVMVAKSRR